MKKCIIGFILSIGTIFGSYAQDVFNRIYMNIHSDSSLQGEWISQIIEVDNGFAYLMNSGNVNTNEFEMIFEKIDFSGDRILSKKYGESNKRYLAQDMIVTGLNEFCVTGGIITNGSVERPWFVAKLDNNGDTLWLKTGFLAGDTTAIGWAIIEASDGGFVIVGQSGDTASTDWNCFMLKTDSSGNELWHRQYGGTFSEGAHSVIETEDRGFLIAGQTRSFGAGELDGYLVKTDSLGNQSWQKTFGSSSVEVFSSISKTANGDYVLAGGANYSGYRAWLLKIDSLGNTIWNKPVYCAPEGGHFYNAKVLPSGNIMAVGVSYNSKHTSNEMGVMYLMDANGDSLWSYIYSDSIDWDAPDLFYNFVPTNDGGFIACGLAVRYHGFPIESNDGWIVKVDSNGCFNTECDFYDAIFESRRVDKNLKVYPNPTLDKVFITTDFDAEYVTIVNLLGVVVRDKYKVLNNTVDLSTFPPGVYCLLLTNREKQDQVIKVVKVP